VFLFLNRDITVQTFSSTDGYINEGGKINVKRLQVVLDEMAQWEQEVFEKEYADINWYKGKQDKHMKQLENGRKRGDLGEQFHLPGL
jgi:5'-3' exoribonuclease 1